MVGFTIRRVAVPSMMIGRIGLATLARPHSDFKVADRALVNAPFWGVHVQASAPKVISGPSQPNRKVDPALQNVLAHAYRRRHVAKVIDEARLKLLNMLRSLDAFKTLHDYVCGVTTLFDTQKQVLVGLLNESTRKFTMQAGK